MTWLSISALESALPDHCEPTSDFLRWFSSTSHTCVPSPLAFVSIAFGTLSIVSWLFAQLPQIYKNWSISSTSGLSIFFLVEWCLGDVSNLLGALFTHQATWQCVIGAYYVFVDVCLVGQWLWYEKLRHGNIVWRVRPKADSGRDGGPDDAMQQVVIDGMPIIRTTSGAGGHHSTGGEDHGKQPSRPQIIFKKPTYETERKSEDEKPSSSLSTTPGGNAIYRAGAASPMPSPSPRTMLLIACLVAIVQASPMGKQHHPPFTHQAVERQPTTLESAGTILSWLSTVLYLGSRLPQLFKNWRRKSTAGLSPHLFMAAFLGNLFYSSALLTNPCAWFDFEPYGDGGWAGPDGSDRAEWVAAALPFFLGAAGVLGLDASVGIQFLLYRESATEIVVFEEDKNHRWQWRRVSGWLRGWVPSITAPKREETEALLERNDGHGEGYGALS